LKLHHSRSAGLGAGAQKWLPVFVGEQTVAASYPTLQYLTIAFADDLPAVCRQAGFAVSRRRAPRLSSLCNYRMPRMKSPHAAPIRLKHQILTGFDEITGGGLPRGRRRVQALRGADTAMAGDQSSPS
jgi:hypothetical protein